MSLASRTKIPAPSPMLMPLRFLEKGRHLSGVRTRKASHDNIVPLVIEASDPPTIARSTMPARIICIAIPMAWVAAEQALAAAKVGPVQRERMPIVAGPALAINRGTVNGSG